MARLPYQAIWVVDFEFIAKDGEYPQPICMVALDLVTGQWLRLWREDLTDPPPFGLGENSLFVAYAAQAEWSCFLQLGWPVPARSIDLFAEYVNEHNGRQEGRLFPSLLAAAAQHSIPTMGAAQKEIMRDLILSGGPWDSTQRAAILEYCAADVAVTAALFRAMESAITSSFPRHGQALLRGRYTCAVAAMERHGIPIDTESYRRIKGQWDEIKRSLVAEIDRAFNVYDGTSFVTRRFIDFLNRAHIPWPRLASGQPALDDETFRVQARLYPVIQPLRELRGVLSKLRTLDLPVGLDGRLRTALHPFASKTGRNQPSNARFIFGAPRWLRGLIKPASGRALAYIDWASQEIAIAAALSGDAALWVAYTSGDPYLAFAKQAGLAPEEASKKTHKAERNRAKVIMLGVNYGMSAKSIALQAGLHMEEARRLLAQHKETYRTFWDWAESNLEAGSLGLPLQTVYGWTWRAGQGTQVNPRSLLNWPMQAGGAEMMRLACCELTEQGITTCCPIHDALLVEASLEAIDHIVTSAQAAMAKASELVLGTGKIVRTDVEIVRFPDRYMDEAGGDLWQRVMRLLNGSAPVVAQTQLVDAKEQAGHEGTSKKPSRADGAQGVPQRINEEYHKDRRGVSEDATPQSVRAVDFSRYQ